MTLLLPLAALSLAAPSAAEPAAPTYAVETRLNEGERLLGTPGFTLRAGSPASISTPAYRLSITVTPDADGERLAIASEVSLPDGKGWRIAANPAFRVAEGNEASIAIQPKGSSEPLRLAVIARHVGSR